MCGTPRASKFPMKRELIRFANVAALCAIGGAVLGGQAVKFNAQLRGKFQPRVKRYAALRDGQRKSCSRRH
jgi:hypothetical protein